MEQTLRITERPFEGGMILDLAGDITRAAEETVLKHQSWEQGWGAGHRFLVLNFTHVPYINSAGIACLIRFTRAGLKHGCHLFAYGLTPHYQKLFRIVGLTEHLMVYPDEFSVMSRIEELAKLSR